MVIREWVFVSANTELSGGGGGGSGRRDGGGGGVGGGGVCNGGPFLCTVYGR